MVANHTDERDGARGGADPDAWMAMDEPELRVFVRRIAHMPSRLAYWLIPFTVADLSERLGCDRRVVLQLHLCPTPRLQRWRADAQTMAMLLHLDADRLLDLLQEAEAHVRAGAARRRPA